MRSRLEFAAALLLSMVPATSPHAADFDLCASCHGIGGEGNRELGAPRIAGLSREYVQRQLDDFRRGLRGRDPRDGAGAQMGAMAGALEGELAVARVADYVANLRAEAASPSIQADLREGRQLFASCEACHGARGEGIAALSAPRLAGMSDWYLLRQIAAFRSGVRGADGGGPAARMKAVAATLTDEKAIRDAIAYAASLPEPLTGSDKPAATRAPAAQ